MLITTLGTSHGDPTYCRFNSSTLFEIGGYFYLADVGAPANALMIRADKDPRKIKAIFVTHMHEDHVGGLPNMLKALIKYKIPGQFTDVFLPDRNAGPGLLAWIKSMYLELPAEVIGLHTTDAGPETFYDDGIVKVTRIPTRHIHHLPYLASFSYMFEAEGKKIMYSGDLRNDFSDFPLIGREDEDFDICFCEATHYEPEVALPVLERCKIKKLVLNHIHNPWHGTGEQVLLDKYASLQYPVVVAHDGDSFEL